MCVWRRVLSYCSAPVVSPRGRRNRPRPSHPQMAGFGIGEEDWEGGELESGVVSESLLVRCGRRRGSLAARVAGTRSPRGLTLGLPEIAVCPTDGVGFRAFLGQLEFPV